MPLKRLFVRKEPPCREDQTDSKPQENYIRVRRDSTSSCGKAALLQYNAPIDAKHDGTVRPNRALGSIELSRVSRHTTQ